MRAYLVVMDETEEAKAALRFASLRALATDSIVHILALVPRQTFNAFGGVQATIEQEAKERAEVIANSAAGSLFMDGGRMPKISVSPGDPASVIRTYLQENDNVMALVLGAAKDGGPGPLVNYFSGVSGTLPCPLYIIPDLPMDRLRTLSGVHDAPDDGAD